MRISCYLVRIGLGIVRIFSSAFYPTSAFSHPRFILHPPFLIRVLSSIRLFSSAFYPPSAFSHPYFLICIRIRHPYPHPYPRFIPTLRIFSSAFYSPSAFSRPRFILHPHFLIRVLSSIRIFSSASAFYAYPCNSVLTMHWNHQATFFIGFDSAG